MSDSVVQDSKVVVLCGGRGARLKPQTDVVPKALVPINGRPILEYIIDFYRARGLSSFVLCVGYKGEQIAERYETPPPGIEISISDSGEDASMLQRIWAVRDLIGERAFVSYCDTFIDLDLDGLMANHLDHEAAVTLVSAKIKSPFGLLTFDSDSWVSSFVEKPLLTYYIGCFILERAGLSHVTPEMLESDDGQGLVAFFQDLVAKKLLAGFEHEGMQITFNTESEREQAEEYLGQFYTYIEDSEDL